MLWLIHSKAEKFNSRQIHVVLIILNKSFRGIGCSWRGIEGEEGWAWTHMSIMQKKTFKQCSYIPWVLLFFAALQTHTHTLTLPWLFLPIFCLVAKPCAHVTCKTCTDTLVRPAKQCIVCDSQLKEKDILELKREGLGVPFLGLLLLLLHPPINITFF